MPLLLVESPETTAGTSIGGRPLAPINTNWPVCKICHHPMQFLAQLQLASVPEVQSHSDQVLLLFQCQNQPGLCDEWEPNSGGNAAVLVASNDRLPLQVPAGETLLSAESKVQYVPYAAVNGGTTPDDRYCEEIDAWKSQVLGKLGGEPLWIQSNETPTCTCGSEMTFVAQLEERGGGGINFGGGAGYAFVCRTCRNQARFLWQCA